MSYLAMCITPIFIFATSIITFITCGISFYFANKTQEKEKNEFTYRNFFKRFLMFLFFPTLIGLSTRIITFPLFKISELLRKFNLNEINLKFFGMLFSIITIIVLILIIIHAIRYYVKFSKCKISFFEYFLLSIFIPSVSIHYIVLFCAKKFYAEFMPEILKYMN